MLTALLLTILITIGLEWTLLGVVLVSPVSAGFPDKAAVLLAHNIGRANTTRSRIAPELQTPTTDDTRLLLSAVSVETVRGR